MSSSPDGPKLPEDVVVEILKRLPVKSLLRFRCVCRSWHSTFDDPRFVALHLTHSAVDACNWYVVCRDVCDPRQSLCSLFSGESFAGPSTTQIEIPFAARPRDYGFVGSCNGLICVAEYFGYLDMRSLYLWNVFTREYKAVPQSSLGNRFFSVDTDDSALGFGFDTNSNDYKIVMIHYLLLNDQKRGVEVYSLSTHSWRSLECEVPAFFVYSKSIFLKGNLHWLIFKHDPQEEDVYASIVLFDLAREVFDEIALSDELLRIVHVGLLCVGLLCVLNDLLAVCTVTAEQAGHPKFHSVCPVWVMSEYGVPDSWIKLYTFEACGLVSGFDGFTRSGKLLMKIDNERVVWNPITGEFTNLPLSANYNLVAVVESLVSL